MPSCEGCGHSVRQWFVLDIRAIPPLREKLPAWTLFPLLGCMDCMVWMGRLDYSVAADGLSVRLENTAFATKQYGECFGHLPRIPKQYVELAWVPPNLDPSQEEIDKACPWDRPQIAGSVWWTQQPCHVFCRSCRKVMMFVAAMASPTGFEPYIPINNGSGFQYHFACNACRTISVIAQWT